MVRSKCASSRKALCAVTSGFISVLLATACLGGPELGFALEADGTAASRSGQFENAHTMQEAKNAKSERTTAASELGYMPGEVVVVYEPDATAAEKREAADIVDGQTGKEAEFECLCECAYFVYRWR